MAQTASAGLAEGKTQIEAARAKITAAGAAVEGAIEKIDGNLAQLWYDMGKLDDEEPELEQKRAALLDEAVELAEEKAAAEERKEDEQKLGATRRTLRSYDGIKAKLTDGAELGEVAAQYADEYYAEFNREHTARIAISVLEVLGGILGLCCIPAAFEKCRSRLVLVVPAVAAFVCAAGGDRRCCARARAVLRGAADACFRAAVSPCGCAEKQAPGTGAAIIYAKRLK